MEIERDEPKVSKPASAPLQQVMRAAGWEIEYVDLDLTQEKPKLEIRINRDDGRWLLARVDRFGRATMERFQRERTLGMPKNTAGRRPLSPQVDDVFLGRSRYEGARMLLRHLTSYVADNALRPVSLAAVRSAWALVMAAPLRIEAVTGGEVRIAP